jgi:sugar O-acyltransferase (sialic acid O-acetyltransferase NeuD family)
MSKPGLVLIGAGGHARACIDVIEQQGRFEIAGLVGSAAELHTRQLGYEVIATDAELAQLAAQYRYALVTVGQIGSHALRMRLHDEALRLGFELPVIVAPGAHVSRHATVGAGSIVMHGAVVNAAASVGRNCIINTRALVEHDAVVGDHCHISTGAILNGAVVVGAGSFVGSGCVLKQGLTLGEHCVVGMGLALRHDQPDHARFLG